MKFQKRKINSAWKSSTILGRMLVYVYAISVIIPLAFVVVTALKTGQEITLNPLGLPEKIMWSNFKDAFEQGKLWSATWNSVINSVSGITLQMLSVVTVSYCIHRLRDNKLGTLMYVIILMGMFIPKVGHVTMVRMMRDLHLYNTRWAVILPAAVGIPFGVFIVAGFLRTIPRELEEAAMLDGAKDIDLLFRVLLPLIKPAMVTIGIVGFTGIWNAGLGPLLYIRSKELYTIPMALLTFQGTHSIQYELMFAAMLATGLPIVVIYLFCQKYFTEALSGGVKG